MNRIIKFRGLSRSDNTWAFGYLMGYCFIGKVVHNSLGRGEISDLCEVWDNTVSQATGLTDKNGLKEVYEGDIIDTYGEIKGNIYESEEALKDPANFVIEGFGTSYWRTAEKEALGRGCKYTK